MRRWVWLLTGRVLVCACQMKDSTVMQLSDEVNLLRRTQSAASARRRQGPPRPRRRVIHGSPLVPAARRRTPGAYSTGTTAARRSPRDGVGQASSSGRDDHVDREDGGFELDDAADVAASSLDDNNMSEMKRRLNASLQAMETTVYRRATSTHSGLLAGTSSDDGDTSDDNAGDDAGDDVHDGGSVNAEDVTGVAGGDGRGVRIGALGGGSGLAHPTPPHPSRIPRLSPRSTPPPRSDSSDEMFG